MPRARTSRPALLTVLGAIVLVASMVVGWGVVELTGSGSMDADFIGFIGLLFVGLWAYWWLGVLIVMRADGNGVGWVFATGSALTSAVFACFAAQGPLVATTSFGALAPWLGLLGAICFTPMIILLLPAVAILFPTGTIPSARWRWPVRLVIVLAIARSVAVALEPGPIGGNGPDNPLPPLLPDVGPAVVGTLNTIDQMGNVALLLAVVLGVAAVITRVRHAGGDERLQMRWFLAAMVPAAILVPLSLGEATAGVPFLDLISVATLPLAAAAVALAILRYRLYEIDRIISRTIGWALVTGLLLTVYAVGVLLLSTLLAGIAQGQTLAVAASTLIAFALFQPVRRRVQHAVDRRFDRAQYDSHATVGAFAGRIRNEVDLDRLRGMLTTTADASVHPTSAAVWLRG